MVVGGVYRALLNNVQVRDFLGLSLYDSADARAPIVNKPLELDVPAGTAVFNGSRVGAYSSNGLSPVHGALGAYQTNPSTRMFSR